MVDEELLLALEADINLPFSDDLCLETSDDINRFLQNSKEVIRRIVEDIKRYFKDLVTKITAFLSEARINAGINKIERMERTNPKFRNYKVMAVNTEKYAALYTEYIKSLNAMNTMRDVPPNYAEKLNSIYNDYVNAVSGMGASRFTIPKIVVMNRIVLNTVKVLGTKSFPEPRNEVIARAYARAATECGKLCSTSIRQLADAINSNKMKRFFDDMARILR